MRIGVYGLGNVLRRDDGFGPSAVRRLESRHEFPENVVLRDLGTPGLDLASHFVGFDAVILLDTARTDGQPGMLRVFDRDEILAGDAASPRVTDHDLDVRGALQLAELAGGAPRVVRLIGVVPEDLGTGTGLSPAVEAALGPACERARAEIERLGIEVRRRAEPQATGAWWQDAATAASR